MDGIHIGYRPFSDFMKNNYFLNNPKNDLRFHIFCLSLQPVSDAESIKLKPSYDY